MSARRWPYALIFIALHGACSEVVRVLDDDPGNAGGAGNAGGEPAAGAGAGSIDATLGTFVDAGNAHACAIRSGALYCWGAGADGRLGLGDTSDRDAPERVGADADWSAVATGVEHSCALKRDGSVWCFGANDVGQLGQGTTLASSEPLRVPLPGPVLQLSSAANTACGVLDTHELYCWGRNWEGNIGLDDTHPGVDHLSPVRSGQLSDWTLIGTGDGHTCGIRAGGLLFGWGRNTAANLGLGQKNDQQRRAATRIGEADDWQLVVAGQDSSCGIRLGDKLFCWGENDFGNLGTGDTQERLTPSPIVPERRWAQVSIDTFHACGVDVDDDLYCWGRGIEGQLGTSDNEERLEPVWVGAGFAQVAVGLMFTCAVTRGGAVLCTGENAAGQLGVEDDARRNILSELTFR